MVRLLVIVGLVWAVSRILQELNDKDDNELRD